MNGARFRVANLPFEPSIWRAAASHNKEVCQQQIDWKIVSGLVLLILRNREAGVLYVGFDFRSVQVDDALLGTFAYKQFGPSNMIRRQ
jgi:hypothetical protein